MKIPELQEQLIRILHRNVKLIEIGKALELDNSSISMRIKRNSELNARHIQMIESYFNINLSKNDSTEKEECVTIERIHINPSCGSGAVVIDEAEVTPITLGKKMIQSILRVSNINNLKVFRASGDSMEPTICDNDDVLVDIGRKDYINGGVFVIEKFGDWFIKRLHLKFDGNLEIISDNKDKYQSEVIKLSDGVEINIKGRVIKNLSRGL